MVQVLSLNIPLPKSHLSCPQLPGPPHGALPPEGVQAVACGKSSETGFWSWPFPCTQTM